MDTKTFFTPKSIADAEKRHTKAMADASAQRDVMLVETLIGLEHSMQKISKRIDDFNSNENNLSVMRVIRSWFGECDGGTSVVHLPQVEHCARDEIEIIALDKPMLFVELDGTNCPCGGDEPKSLDWNGVGNILLYFKQYKYFPSKTGYEVKLTGDNYNEKTFQVVFSDRLATAPCVIMSYDDGRIGIGSTNGLFPWSQVDAARRAVADGMVKEGDLDVVIANNIRLISAMRRFIDSFKGITHLVGMKEKCRNEHAENVLNQEILRYRKYDSRIKIEIGGGQKK